MNTKENTKRVAENSLPGDRFTVKPRLNLNDLLRRRSEEKQVDKKANLVIISSVTAIAAVVLLILSL